MTPGQIVMAVRAIVVLLVLALVLAFMHWGLDLVRAPLKAQLDASRGNQAAAKAGIEQQNAAVEAEGKVAEKKKAESAKAVAAAGKPQFQRAEEIIAQPAQGSTPLERAHRRIDTELGL